jgi:peptidoglycan/LPS O-acetylase OafA/YrhL
MTTKPRIVAFDFIRTNALILVVLCHIILGNSTVIGLRLQGEFGILGNGLFFLISGYLIRINNPVRQWSHVLPFLKKRLLRLFPLYWLALIVMILYVLSTGGIIDLSTLVVTIPGLQMIFFPNYIGDRSFWFVGVWFLGMLVIFYLLYSVIFLFRPKNTWFLIIAAFLTIIPLGIMKIMFGIMAGGIFEYYPFFVTGILLAFNPKMFEYLLRFRHLHIVAFIVLLTLSTLYYLDIGVMETSQNLSMLDYAAVGLAVLTRYALVVSLLFTLHVVYNAGSGDWSKAFTYISGASYCVYLFHGIIYTKMLFSLYEHIDVSYVLINLVDILVILPIVIVICYHLQITYDVRIGRLLGRREAQSLRV